MKLLLWFLENQVRFKANDVVEPLFLANLPKDLKPGDSFELAGTEAKHAISVRRMKTGESIALGDGKDLKVHGLVSSIGKESLTVEVTSIEKIPAPKVEIVLVQALAKGDRDELAIQASTELGIFGVIPWQAERSVSIWKAEKIAKGKARWQSIVAEAAKQSLRPRVPEVSDVVSTIGLIESLKDTSLVLVLDPTADQSIVAVELPQAGSVAIVVGPEGGISDEELKSFRAASFKLVHLGVGILRTSTAGVAAVSFLKASLGEWA